MDLLLLRLRGNCLNASADIDVDIVRGICHIGIHYGGCVIGVEADGSDYAGWMIVEALKSADSKRAWSLTRSRERLEPLFNGAPNTSALFMAISR